MKISYTRAAFESEIYTPNAHHSNQSNKVELPKTNDRYMPIVFTDNV